MMYLFLKFCTDSHLSLTNCKVILFIICCVHFLVEAKEPGWQVHNVTNLGNKLHL